MGEWKCNVLADSVDAATRTRIVSLDLSYPRGIHDELATHGLFERNSQSRRAMAQDAAEADANLVPIFYSPSPAGSPMNAGPPLDPAGQARSAASWLRGRAACVEVANELRDAGCHRFFSNWVIEPWAWIRTVVTSTSWANFYSLRIDPGAEPHMFRLAEMMKAAIAASVPVLRTTSWHLPAVSAAERRSGLTDQQQRDVSAWRCAQVSFGMIGGMPLAKELQKAERLLVNRHLSPFANQAFPCPGRWAKFDNWRSYRNTIPGEFVADEPYSGPTISEEE